MEIRMAEGMDTKLDTRLHDKAPSASVGGNSAKANFDFDRWAVEVRQQMIAALKKRGIK
jgi:hypothetical protein